MQYKIPVVVAAIPEFHSSSLPRRYDTATPNMLYITAENKENVCLGFATTHCSHVQTFLIATT